jgi:hypothetical protein
MKNRSLIAIERVNPSILNIRGEQVILDAVYIENMHDVPYLRGEVGPEIVAAMTLIGTEVKSESHLPVGIIQSRRLVVQHSRSLTR